MAEFDPYLKWLGIRDPARPVNHYRLLGLDLFESDPEIISMAADRQMAHVRTYQAGPNGDVSQQLLNELSRARRCLLTPEKKVAYDAQLAEKVNVPNALVQPQEPFRSENATPEVSVQFNEKKSRTEFGIRKDPNEKKKAKKRQQKQLIWSIASWVSGGLCAVGVAAWLINSGFLDQFKPEPQPNEDWPIVVSEDDPRSNHANSTSNGQGKRDPIRSNPGNSVTPDRNNSRVSDNQIVKDPLKPKDRVIGRTVDGTPIIEETPETKPDLKRSAGDRMSMIAGIDNRIESALATVGIASYKKLGEVPVTKLKQLLLASGIPSKADSFYENLIIQARSRAGLPALDSFDWNRVAKTSSAVKQWSLDSMTDYPISANEIQGLMRELSSSYENVSFSDLELSESDAASKPDDLSSFKRNQILIGLALTLTPKNHVSSLQPIYVSKDQASLGPEIGTATERTVDLIARPGYAVGEVERSIYSPNRCVRITFFKVEPNGLNPKDAYQSPWVGMNRGPTMRIQNQNGLPVVGFFATETNRVADRFGLVLASKDAASTNTAVQANPSDPSFFAKNDPAATDPVRKLPDIFPGMEGSSSEPKGSPGIPLPSGKDLQKARVELVRIYPSLVQAKSDYQKKRIADQFLTRTEWETKSPDITFAMLEQVRLYAVERGDAEMAMEAIEGLNTTFQFDYWEAVLKTMKEVSASRNAVSLRTFQSTLDRKIAEALDTKEFDAATELLKFGRTLAANARQFKTRDEYAQQSVRVADLKRLYRDGKLAYETLSKNPADRSANEIYGEYLLVVEEDLEKAIESWNRAGTGDLFRLAELESEIQKERDSETLVQAAMIWEKIGQKKKSEVQRVYFDHAVRRYKSAARGLSGPEKSKVLRQADELLQKSVH